MKVQEKSNDGNKTKEVTSIGVLVTKGFVPNDGNKEENLQAIHYLNLERHKTFIENIFSVKEGDETAFSLTEY